MLVFNQGKENETHIYFNEFNDISVHTDFTYGSNNHSYELYSSNTFMNNQLDITQLTKDQNQTLRIFINVYEYELSQLKQFYQINQIDDVIGYGKESNQKVREGFNIALNKVYNVCNTLAINKAKLHIQNLL